MTQKTTTTASKQKLLNNYLELAREFQSQQMYAKAEETLKLALDISPRNPRILSALINLYLKQGWLEEAQRLLQEILRRHKEFKYAYYLRGKLHEARGNIAQAIKSYQQALSDKASDQFVLRRLIPLLLERHKYQQALELIYHYRDILNNPDFMVTLEARALAQLGKPARASQLLRERVMARPDVKHFVYQYLKTFVENSRKSPRELYETLRQTTPGLAELTPAELDGLEAEYLIKNGKLEEALELINTLIEREPQKAYWQKRKAFLLLELERQEAALPLLKELFLKDPTDVFVRSSLESYYLHRNKIREWKQLLKETFTLHPNRMELFGLIRRASLHQDWLAGCQLTYDRFKRQIRQLTLEPLDPNDQTFQKLPLYVFENFVFYLAMNDRIPDAATLWQFLQERKERINLPFQEEDLRKAMPMWLFALQFYFAFRKLECQPQFVPARFQKEWIAAIFSIEGNAIFLEIKSLLHPPKRTIKPLRKKSGGYLWRLLEVTPDQMVNTIPFVPLKQLRKALTELQQSLTKKDDA